MTLLQNRFPLSSIEKHRSSAPVSSDDDRNLSLFRNGSNYSHTSDEYQSRHHYGGRDTDRFFGAFEEDESEAEEQPAELVPLGIRGGRSPRGNKHHQHTGFHDFYKLTEEHLGAGAYASVKTCISKTTGKEYAVKVVDKNEESHTRSRILREVNTFNMCKHHPNIVQLVEWFEDSDNFYMIFEKMRGGPLLQHILSKGYFTEEQARMVTKDIATALKFLHDRGIAHRDVKPENILCTEPDRVSPVKLCDLDLASRPVKGHSPPRMSQVASEPDLASPVGSAEFMAPEVVDAFVGDAFKYDKRCDMWSLGVILYIMLCGYAPFQGECSDEECGWMEGQPCEDCQQELFSRIQRGQYDFPSEEWDMISHEAKDLVTHLLKKNVRERFTADEVLDHPWIKQSAPRTILQTPSNLFRNDSARDVQQMSEHFNVMNRLVAARLSSRLENLEIAEDDEESLKVIGGQASEASPTNPPPWTEYEHQTVPNVPLFMVPPVAFFDHYSGTMVYPPNSMPPSPAPAAKNVVNRSSNSFVPSLSFCSSFGSPSHRARNSVGGMRRFIGSTSRGSKSAVVKPELETCQTAMAIQDSKTDLHQQTRETEVNV